MQINHAMNCKPAKPEGLDFIPLPHRHQSSIARELKHQRFTVFQPVLHNGTFAQIEHQRNLGYMLLGSVHADEPAYLKVLKVNLAHCSDQAAVRQKDADVAADETFKVLAVLAGSAGQGKRDIRLCVAWIE